MGQSTIVPFLYFSTCEFKTQTHISTMTRFTVIIYYQNMHTVLNYSDMCKQCVRYVLKAQLCIHAFVLKC